MDHGIDTAYIRDIESLSIHDAEDLVQDTFVRGWKAYGNFKGDSSLRTWLYRIATNTCLTSLEGRSRRPLPSGLGAPSSDPSDELVERHEIAWLEPVPDAAVVVAERDTLRLAFVAALQHLPPRQRAVLILREVLRWKADEVAGLLDTTVASVNSALQRARATLADLEARPAPRSLDDDDRELLARYLDAFERYDIEAFVQLLHEDATQHMPPFEMWLRGASDIGTWMRGPGSECEGSRVFLTSANGTPAVAQYRPRAGGGHEPWGLHVLEIEGGKVAHISTFLDVGTGLFVKLGLPAGFD